MARPVRVRPVLRLARSPALVVRPSQRWRQRRVRLERRSADHESARGRRTAPEGVGSQSRLRYEKRLDEFRDSRLESMRLSLLSSAPVYPAMEEAILAAWLEGARSTLGADDPFVRVALENQ